MLPATASGCVVLAGVVSWADGEKCEGVPAVRVQKIFNRSARSASRPTLPAPKRALIATSCVLVVASAGAFAATLPALSRGTASADPGEKSAELQVEATGGEARDAAAAPDAQGDPEAQDATAPDGATGAAGEGVPASGGSSSGTAASATSEGPSSAGAPAGAAAGSSGSASSSSTNTSGPSGASGSGSGHGSGSDASAPSNGSTAADPFSATPSAADEQKFHAFLAGWYGRLGACEAEAAAGDSNTCWSGYAAVRDYVRSNASQWCGAQENLIGAFRCLAWYAESGDESDLAEYRSYKSAVSL